MSYKSTPVIMCLQQLLKTLTERVCELQIVSYLRYAHIGKSWTIKHEVHWRDRGRPGRKSRTCSRVQAVFKIQKRTNWNSHLRCLWGYRVLFTKERRCVLGISQRYYRDANLNEFSDHNGLQWAIYVATVVRLV